MAGLEGYRVKTWINNDFFGERRLIVTSGHVPDPCRIYGWAYHNENDFTFYAKFYNFPAFFFDKDNATPLLRIGMAPDQSSGHVANVSGIKFDVGCTIWFRDQMPDNTPLLEYPLSTLWFEVYYLLESDL